MSENLFHTHFRNLFQFLQGKFVSNHKILAEKTMSPQSFNWLLPVGYQGFLLFPALFQSKNIRITL